MMNAPAGQVWVDERVARRVSQSFDIEQLGAQKFKGFAVEQQVYILHGRKPSLDAVYQGEMVGREGELNRLVEFVQSMWQGHFAGVIGVAGDAGIGKGRLVHAFQTSPVFREHKAMWAICQADQILRQSFNPLRRWLNRYFSFFPNQAADERKLVFDAKLDELLASISDPKLAQELNRTRSILGALVDIFWDDSLYSQLDAEGRYNNTFLALIALIKAESLRQPLVLFVDDIHFIDPDTNAFLSQLKRSLFAASMPYPVSIVLAYRKQGVGLQMRDDLLDQEIELGGVSNKDVARLAETVLGGPAAPELVELLISRSEGNPYFTEQIIRYLQEQNLLEMSSDGWRQVRRGRSSALPEDISALLVARLDQLAQEVKSVVQTASVLGREFEVRVLSEMLGPETETNEYVREAEKAVIWLPLREMRYIFYHALLRDAAYAMQMRARRKELHALALSALEEIYRTEQESHYAEFAYHAENGDLRAKAQQYYALAGRVSAGLYQNNQAAEYFTRALAYTPFNDLSMQFDLVAERVELYSRMGKRDLQLKDLEYLEQWAEQLKEDDRFQRVWMLRSAYHYFLGNYQESIEFAKKAENVSGLLVDSELARYTQIVWATSLLRLGFAEEAMQRARSALGQVQVSGHRNEEGRILNVMGLIAMEQKESSPAKKYFEDALMIARETKNREVENRAVSNLAMAESMLNGNYALAREYFEQSYKISQETGDQYGVSQTLGNLGFIAGMQGDFSAARSYQEQALRMTREIGNTYAEIYSLINLSAVDGLINDAGAALRNASQAAELAQKASDRSGEAWAMLYLGHAHLLLGDFDPACRAYQASVDIRNELDQPSLSMEPLAGLVAVHMEENDLEAASRPVEAIMGFLASNSSMEGMEDPLRVLYTCYLYLLKTQDPRAAQILQKAKELLAAQVSKFKDEADRKRYVENIPWRRAIQKAATPLLKRS
jgi:predicted ATPase